MSANNSPKISTVHLKVCVRIALVHNQNVTKDDPYQLSRPNAASWSTSWTRLDQTCLKSDLIWTGTWHFTNDMTRPDQIRLCEVQNMILIYRVLTRHDRKLGRSLLKTSTRHDQFRPISGADRQKTRLRLLIYQCRNGDQGKYRYEATTPPP